MSIPKDCRFTDDHEWARPEEKSVRVGISDYAQQELGDVVLVDLPEVGAAFKKGDSFASVESTKAVSDVYAPVDGKVVAVNELLADQPELVNSEPHGQGWMVVFEEVDFGQLEALKTADAYQKFIEEIS